MRSDWVICTQLYFNICLGSVVFEACNYKEDRVKGHTEIMCNKIIREMCINCG
jgi:hypothetical protein